LREKETDRERKVYFQSRHTIRATAHLCWCLCYNI